MLSLKDFRPSQNFLYEYALENPYCMYAVDMGMGKTITSLTAFMTLLKAREISKILIVAPKRVAAHTWPDEIKTWQHTQHLKFSVITGDLKPAERKYAAESPAKIHIINRENLPWLWAHFGEGRRWPYDALIYDEASRLKGFSRRTKVSKEVNFKIEADGTLYKNEEGEPETQEGRKGCAIGPDGKPLLDKSGKPILGPGKKGGNITEFGVLMKARKNFFKRVIELSGTPAPNGVYDLGGPLCLLDQGERLGKSKTAFKKKYFNENKYDYSIEAKDGAFDSIMSSISDICVSLNTEDYVKMPQIVPIMRKVRMSEKQYKKYKELETSLVLEEFDIEVANRAGLVQKLLQLANGSIYKVTPYVDDKDVMREHREVIHVHDEKLVELESIMQEAAGKPVLIACSYKFDQDNIRKRFPKATFFDECDNAVERWNRGEIEMLVSHPASIGHGLNLQKGSNIAVWYGLNYSLELYLQFNKRLARPGQPEEKVFLYHIICENTYDEKILPVLEDKDAEENMVLKAIEAPKELVCS